MACLTDLINDTVNYLRVTGVLDGKPVFEKTVIQTVPTDPRALWEEYYGQQRFWRDATVNFHTTEFERIDKTLRRTSCDIVQTQALAEIPDSPNTVIIEVGSGYGIKGAGYVAAYKPNAQVVLISKKEQEDFPPYYLFIKHPNRKHELTFHSGKELLAEPDIEKRVNALYKANGIHNVRFYSYEFTDADIGELPRFLTGLEGKDIYLFGHKAPRVLPFSIAMLIHKFKAHKMVVSPTSQERVPAGAMSWHIVQKQLGLHDAELGGYINSAYDPVQDHLNPKYRYDNKGLNPGQQRIGVMIKLGIALALAREVDGIVLRNTELNPNGYNQIDHYVEAVQK